MCGISVLLDRAASPESHARLLRMHEPIRHRGPDGEGMLVVDARGRWQRHDSPAAGAPIPPALLGLAFRRLKILDLTEAAAQPMASPDGSIWIVFNGEIYNFRELRRELEARGRLFRSTGDTEVALAAYEAWGEGCFEHLDGMWAIVVADLRRRRLVASRDRFGIKPLYWAVEGPRLFLASEIKQILAARTERPRANAALLSLFLRGLRLPCLEETFFERVRAVPPATWFEVPLDGEEVAAPAFRRYWELSDFHCPEPDRPRQGYAEAVDAFRTLLRAAVSSHDVADVSVGSLLSGGLDSSTLVGLRSGLPETQGRRLPTFSFGFRGVAPGLCELRYVDAVVERYGLENHQTGYDGAWVVENARSVVRALEEPPLSLAAAAQYRVFQLCREHGTTVVVDGQGADEILAGYAYHERTLLADRLRKGRIDDFLRELRAIEKRQSVGALEVLTDYVLLPAARRFRRGYRWLAAGYGRRGNAAELAEAFADRGRDPSLVNRRLYYDLKWGNAKVILLYGDKSAMAHSVEARVPYFDRRLVEFAFSLPDGYKVGGGDRKRILRDVARPLLPPDVTERPDRLGFAVPAGPMVRGEIWPRVRATIEDEGFRKSPCFDGQRLLGFLGGFESGRHDDFPAIWRLYALALWVEEFGARIG